MPKVQNGPLELFCQLGLFCRGWERHSGLEGSKARHNDTKRHNATKHSSFVVVLLLTTSLCCTSNTAAPFTMYFWTKKIWKFIWCNFTKPVRKGTTPPRCKKSSFRRGEKLRGKLVFFLRVTTIIFHFTKNCLTCENQRYNEDKWKELIPQNFEISVKTERQVFPGSVACWRRLHQRCFILIHVPLQHSFTASIQQELLLS